MLRRLNLQHEVVKRAFSNRVLFPPYTADASYFVLDSGTGTGQLMVQLVIPLMAEGFCRNLAGGSQQSHIPVRCSSWIRRQRQNVSAQSSKKYLLLAQHHDEASRRVVWQI